MTYDLRRLRLHGIIERIPRTIRYRLTGYGPEVATAYTLATIVSYDPALRCSPLRHAYNRFASRSCLAA